MSSPIGKSRPLRPLWATTAIYGTMFFLGLLLLALTIHYVAVRSLIADLDARLETESRAILGGGAKAALPDVERRIAERQWHAEDDDLAYLLVDRTGKVISGNARLRLPPLGASDVSYLEASGAPDRGRALAVRGSDGSMLVLVADYGPVEVLNEKLTWIGALSLLGTLTMGALAGTALTASVSRRIEATTRAAESIMAGDLQQRMPFDGSGGAFDRQATTLNRMLDRIEALMDELRQVSADIAHDLRTPLALLRSRLVEMFEKDAGEISTEEVGLALQQSDRLLALFSAILRISEVESGSRRDSFRRVDLQALAVDVAADFAPIAEEHSQSLLLSGEGPVFIHGDRELIAQALMNLLENAIKYTGPGTQITVEARHGGGAGVLKVRDDGPGIAPYDLETALRRFGRLDGSRSKPGHGLGLSLVASVARAHGGELILSEARPGLAAELRLPLIK